MLQRVRFSAPGLRAERKRSIPLLSFDMGAFDSILELIRTLTREERVRLAGLLLKENSTESDEDEEIAAGQRGLASWSESAVGEDWSEFYPASLSRKKVG